IELRGRGAGRNRFGGRERRAQPRQLLLQRFQAQQYPAALADQLEPDPGGQGRHQRHEQPGKENHPLMQVQVQGPIPQSEAWSGAAAGSAPVGAARRRRADLRGGWYAIRMTAVPSPRASQKKMLHSAKRQEPLAKASTIWPATPARQPNRVALRKPSGRTWAARAPLAKNDPSTSR